MVAGPCPALLLICSCLGCVATELQMSLMWAAVAAGTCACSSGHPSLSERQHWNLQVLLYAQLRDNTNNMVKVVTNVERETKVSALINGGRTAGIVVMSQAMTVLLEKSRQNGVGIVGTNHTCTGSGAIGWVGGM